MSNPNTRTATYTFDICVVRVPNCKLLSDALFICLSDYLLGDHLGPLFYAAYLFHSKIKQSLIIVVNGNN